MARKNSGHKCVCGKEVANYTGEASGGSLVVFPMDTKAVLTNGAIMKVQRPLNYNDPNHWLAYSMGHEVMFFFEPPLGMVEGLAGAIKSYWWVTWAAGQPTFEYQVEGVQF